jgi:HTH-type transcriptional repressor of NAD biosynthesis genes
MKGFVFGKFYPFHKGHLAMIEFAAKHCSKLSVLICCSDKEKINAEIRLNWIKESTRQLNNLEIIALNYKESELPNSSVASTEISKLWSSKFKTIVPDVDLLVSSEPYGVFVAGFMNIKHLFYNQKRDIVPVSATKIRTEPTKYWDFLPDAVKSHFVKKIVILGTESTGKSTLTEKLSKTIPALAVQEAGREVISDSKNFSIEDLYLTAERHKEKTIEALKQLPYCIVLDTDIHITQSYSKFVFGKYLELPKEWYEIQKADLYLYLNNDVPHVQDGGRLTEEERNRLDLNHKETLDKFGVSYTLISGSWEQRMNQVMNLISTSPSLQLLL